MQIWCPDPRIERFNSLNLHKAHIHEDINPAAVPVRGRLLMPRCPVRVVWDKPAVADVLADENEQISSITASHLSRKVSQEPIDNMKVLIQVIVIH